MSPASLAVVNPISSDLNDRNAPSASDRPASGFRIDRLPGFSAPANADPAPTKIRPVGGTGRRLPLVIAPRSIVEPQGAAIAAVSSADVPIERTLLWLGNLLCWLSASLVISVLVLALR